MILSAVEAEGIEMPSKKNGQPVFTRAFISSLLQLPRPLLTAYVDTNPATRGNLGPVPAYLTWLRTETKAVAQGVPDSEQKLFGVELDRVDRFLREKGSQHRGLLIFAGPAIWETLSLSVEVENELHWGKPALSQLLWTASEYKPCGVVVVDRHGARFLRYRPGKITELGQKTFEIDISQWRKKDLGHVIRPGIRKTRGSQRDVFQHRMDAQYTRLCKSLAAQAKKLFEDEDLAAIFLVGSSRLVRPIHAAFPKDFQDRVVLMEEDLGRLSLPRLPRLLGPRIAEWKGQHDMASVKAMIGSERGAVLGIDETLAQLQKGAIRTLILARTFDANVRQCSRCAFASRSAELVCPDCGGERRTTSLRQLLPVLAWAQKVNVEVVAGPAAKTLNELGAMGGWLRRRKHSELP
jgi:Bacterial archaeo-eukaryotic release factor family 10